MSGIKSSSFHGKLKPLGVPNPKQKAIKVDSPPLSIDSAPSATTANSKPSVTVETTRSPSLTKSTRPSTSVSSELVYSRRYLDWNRLTFAYHATGSQDRTFDDYYGTKISYEIKDDRKTKNLTGLYGCAPKTYCVSCKPFGTDGNIYTLLETALTRIVINPERANTPRIILINTGSVRFDLVQGPFTL